MDFLLALVSPALRKALDICFLTGFATAYRLEGSQKYLRGGVIKLPQLRFNHRRQGRKQSRTDDELQNMAGFQPGAVTRQLPNDPAREGNIWLRYEELDAANHLLQDANNQLSDERTMHRSEIRRLEEVVEDLQARSGLRAKLFEQEDGYGALPPLKRAEDKSAPELARELSETRNELLRLTEEMSDAHNQVEFLKSEKSALEAENSRLQQSSRGTVEPLRRRALSIGTPDTPFQPGNPPIADLANEAAGVARGKQGGNMPASQSLASFGSDIELGQAQSTDLDRNAQAAAIQLEHAQIVSLTNEVNSLKEKLASAVGPSAFAGGTLSMGKLQEQNRNLQEENQRLQNKILRFDGDSMQGSAELEDKYNKLLEENTRLQSKVIRLNLNDPSEDPSQSPMVEELKEENAELREDNDKLVAYLESLEKKKKELEDYIEQSEGGKDESAERVMQLTNDNAALIDQVEKLRKKVQEASVPSKTPPVTSNAPGQSEEMDTDLWMLVEDLRDQNRSLIEENKALKTKPEGRSVSIGSDSRTDSVDFARLLTEENNTLQQENARLASRLSSGVAPGDRDILGEALRSNERLLNEKQKMTGQLKRMVEKNTRLILENDALLKEVHSPQNIGKTDLKASGSSKGILSRFSRSLKKKSSRDSKGEAEEELNVDSADASVSSRQDSRSRLGKGDSPSRQLVQELIDENTKLFEENKKLGASAASIKELAEANEKLQEENEKLSNGMELMKELSDENGKLVQENKRLTDSVNKCLQENRDLSARLIDIALQNEDDQLDASFGVGSLLDTTAVERRQAEIAEQMALAEERQRQDAVRRNELNSRANSQLREFETARASSAAAYKRSAANAMARLSYLTQRAAESRDYAEAELFHPAPETPISSPVSATYTSDSQHNARQRSADVARAELSNRIQASRNRSLESPGAVRSLNYQQPEDQVRAAFFEHMGNDDLGSFMQALGYPGFSPLHTTDDESLLIDTYQQALKVTSDLQLSPATKAEDKAMARATNHQLQEWYLQYASG